MNGNLGNRQFDRVPLHGEGEVKGEVLGDARKVKAIQPSSQWPENISNFCSRGIHGEATGFPTKKTEDVQDSNIFANSPPDDSLQEASFP
jgi:hypothetical protein